MQTDPIVLRDVGDAKQCISPEHDAKTIFYATACNTPVNYVVSFDKLPIEVIKCNSNPTVQLKIHTVFKELSFIHSIN